MSSILGPIQWAKGNLDLTRSTTWRKTKTPALLRSGHCHLSSETSDTFALE